MRIMVSVSRVLASSIRISAGIFDKAEPINDFGKMVIIACSWCDVSILVMLATNSNKYSMDKLLSSEIQYK